MVKQWEVRWEGELPARPQDVWDAITQHADGYLWKIEYEPRVGGAERGLTAGGGTVTAWEPPRHFATRTRPETERDGLQRARLRARAARRGDLPALRAPRARCPPRTSTASSTACRQHTTFYHHSLGQYVCHFAGREPVYVSVDGPRRPPTGGFVALRRALGLPDDVVAGDRVRLTPAGLDPIDGVVDYATGAFLGVRSADALLPRLRARPWGWPVGVAHHLFADGADAAASERAWSDWLAGVFETERVA